MVLELRPDSIVARVWEKGIERHIRPTFQFGSFGPFRNHLGWMGVQIVRGVLIENKSVPQAPR
jgi:hypothetical protein